MQVYTIIIKNQQLTHYHVSLSIQIDRQKKHSSTKGKMERPTTMKTEYTWMTEVTVHKFFDAFGHKF